jgi:hypothetical protein
VQVDSTVADHKVDLIVKIKGNSGSSVAAIQINKVIVYPNYSINSDKISTTSDSIVQYKDFTIIDLTFIQTSRFLIVPCILQKIFIQPYRS